MVLALLTSTLLHQASPITIADQDWTLKFSTLGTIGSPLGEIENPFLRGDLSLTRSKAITTDKDQFQLRLVVKRDQSKLVDALTESFPEKKGEKLSKETLADIYRDDKSAYFINSFYLNKTDAKVESLVNNQYSPADEVLNPISIAVAIGQRSLNNPTLRKEFFLMEDGPRKYYITFRPNLNATTDPSKGEVAFKFSLRQKDIDGNYPDFFSGAIRANMQTRKVQYIRATSERDNHANGPDDAAFSKVESFSIQIEAKEPK